MRIGLPGSMMLSTVMLLASCASQAPAPPPASSTTGTILVRTGRVTDIRDVTVRGGRASGLGSFAGAILGGVAGSAIGSGHGSAAAGIGGAVAGGMAGHRIEQSAARTSSTELTVRFDNGDVRTYGVEPGEQFRIGDSVSVMTGNGVSRVTH